MTYTEFLESNKEDPFLIRAATMHMMNRYAVSPDPADQRVAMELSHAARAVIGIARLSIDKEWDALMKSLPWWKRKRLEADCKEWKRSMIVGREQIAIEQVELESLTWV